MKGRPGRVRRAKRKAADTYRAHVKKDAAALLAWAAKTTHTLGHRTSLQAMVAESDHPVIEKLRKLKFKEHGKHEYRPLGMKCEKKKDKCAAHWIRCSGFQYSDEAWEHSDPKREPRAAKGAAAVAGVGGDPRASSQTAKIMQEVGGLVVTIPESGELLAPLLENLISMASTRVAGIVERNAKALLAKGFKFAVYTRDLADRYLADFGLTYDGWMAAVGAGATPSVVARASEIQRSLEGEIAKYKTPRAAWPAR